VTVAQVLRKYADHDAERTSPLTFALLAGAADQGHPRDS